MKRENQEIRAVKKIKRLERIVDPRVPINRPPNPQRPALINGKRMVKKIKDSEEKINERRESNP